MKRVATTLLVAALLASGAANAAEYLIASLIGDRLTVATAVSGTGSNMDRNDYQVLPLPQLPFDDAIHQAVTSTVAKVDAQPTFKALAFREGLPGANLERDTPKEVAQALVKILAPQIKAGEKQWIVALLPYRAEPRIPTKSSVLGHGRVGGLGFYIDRTKAIRRLDTNETDAGFLGVFANFTVLMVDPASGAIASQVAVQGGSMRAVAGSGKTHPWDIATPEEKVRAIMSIASREVRKAMPEALAGAGLK